MSALEMFMAAVLATALALSCKCFLLGVVQSKIPRMATADTTFGEVIVKRQISM